MLTPLLIVALLESSAATTAARPPAKRPLAELVDATDMDAIKARGPKVMDELVRLYEASEPPRRAAVARVFYGLGWKSPAAKKALMNDVHTDVSDLRLQAQWALGRVSDDPDVVDVLVENMRRDGNALFRDKAGCALAYDQIHLNRQQKFRLLDGVVKALADESADVRRIAIQVLEIHTGTRRNYNPFAPAMGRKAALEAWQKWIEEYRASL